MVFLSVVLLGSLACRPAADSAEVILGEVQKNTQNEMELLDRDLSAAAKKLSGLDLAGSESHAILLELTQNRSYLLDACTIDRSGKIVGVEPSIHQNVEGSDVSQQEHVSRLFRTLQPVLSYDFKTVEGDEAAVLDYPIFAPDQTVSGIVNVVIKPEILLGNIISPMVKDTSLAIWGMQPDGRIMYDIDAEEIGLNLFVSPMYHSYPSLLELGREIAVKSTGKGQYQFLDTGLQQTVKKQATWKTFAFHGAEWRLILIQVIP